MDAVSGGASVLAFITLAIQSAKTVSDFLTGIKDAPDNVRRAAASASMLQQVLEQLAQCLQASGVGFARDIETMIRECSNNLAAFAAKLVKLEILDTDGRGRQAWKRVKTVLNENEIEKRTKLMVTHSSILGLSLQSTQMQDPRGGEQISQLSQNLSARWDVIQTDMGGIHANLARADARLEEQWSIIRATLMDQTTVVRDAARTGSNEQLQAIKAVATTQALNRVERRADQQDIENKLSLIMDALQSLMSGMTVRDEQLGSAPCTQDQTHHCEPQAMVLGERKLRDCVDRLRSLAEQDSRTVTAHNADGIILDSIIDDLQYVLLAAAKDQSNELVNVKNLKRIQGLLGSAQMLSINEAAVASSQPEGYIIPQDRRRKVYNMGGDTLTISTVKRRRSRLDTANRSEDGDSIEDFIAKLTYLPRKSTGTSSMFMATVEQRMVRNGFSCSIPRLQANLVLPRGSLVFQLVREGRLPEFEALLRDGRASLRDHDSLGNSLLAIAAFYSEPQICRFLLSNHAEVDNYVFHHPSDTDSDSDDGYFSPLAVDQPLFDWSEEYEKKMQECNKLLLESGADPMLKTEYGGTAFFSAFTSGNLEWIKIYLESSAGFANIHSHDMGGWTPFLWACSNIDPGYSQLVFSFLLDRGANVSELDLEGRSCLHHCLYAPSSHDASYIEREPEALIYLLERGADVRARDYIGRSVSHEVYDPAPGDQIFGSYRRDLWDLVLTACGYNMLEIRGNIRRVGWYPTGTKSPDKEYTRGHFRRLWAGREHLCPYPEDLEDPMPDNTQERVVEVEDREDEASDCAHGGQETSCSDADDSKADNSDADDSSETESSDEDESQRCERCKRRQIGGLQCSGCGWPVGCQDPNCRWCNDSADSVISSGEASTDAQEEDGAMPEAPSPDPPTAEVWPGAFRADPIPFTTPGHAFGLAETRSWLGEVPSLADIETGGGGAHSSIPFIELDNPWEDAD